MRRLLAAIALAAAFPAAAQQVAPPPQLEPIPEAPQQQIGVDQQLAAEAGVTLKPGERAERISTRDGQEFIAVTNEAGVTYYLVGAVPGWGPFPGADFTDSRVRVPQWQLFEW